MQGAVLAELAKILAAVARSPAEGADAIEVLAKQLHKTAAALRSQGGNPVSPGGMGDRVTMAVVGPDGARKQTVDTGGVQ